MMNHIGKNYANLLIAKGILAILFGIFIFVWPAATLLGIMFLIALYALISGLIGFIGGLIHLAEGWSGIMDLIVGLIGIVFGILVLKYAGISLTVYVILLGIWFLLRGLYEFFLPRYKTEGTRGWGIFAGLLDIVVGILLIINPIIGGVILYWIVGIYALIIGPVLITYALFLKSALHNSEERV